MVLKSLLLLYFCCYMVIANPVFNETSSSSPVNKLSLPFLAKLGKTPGENHVFSPLSIATALGLLREGAAGSTLVKMNQFFGNQDIAETVNKIAQKNANAVNSKLNSANLVMHVNGLDLEETYKTNVVNKYKAEVESFDSNNIQAAINRVNSFVSNNTFNLIPHIIDKIDHDTLLMLINAVSLDAKWTKPFKTSDTENGIFHGDTGDKKVKFMVDSDRQVKTYHSKDKKFQLLQLPYKDDLEMIIVLPDDVKGLDSVLSNLTHQDLEKAISQMTQIDVILRLPKFEVKSTYDLVPLFKNLGLNELFDPSANFSNMLSSQTTTSEAKHKAIVKVSEDGTIAVAATFFSRIPGKAEISRPKPEIKVDRLFIFIIREPSTKSHLFVGKIVNIL